MLGIHPGGEQKLRAADVADRVASDKIRRKLLDDGCDHRIEIGDLVVELEIASAKEYRLIR